MLSVNTQTGEVSEVPDTIPLPTVAQLQVLADAETTAKAKVELLKIDWQSIRAIREFILTKFPSDPALPAILATRNSDAALERMKIK